MHTEHAFFQAILDDPDDDALRLIYADWLEENGDEPQRARATFIRSQVELARLADPHGRARRFYSVSRPGPPDPRESRLEELASRLWDQYRVAWFGPAAADCVVRTCQRGFLRGPVSVGSWVQLVKALGPARSAEVWPLGPVTEVELAYAPEDEDDSDDGDPAILRDMPGLASWGGLHLYKHNRDAEQARLLTLLTSPHLVGLGQFDAVRSWIGDTGIAALAEAPAGFRLRRLRLDSCGVGSAGVRRLAWDPAFAELRQLTLCEGAEEDALVELLLSPNLANLFDLFLLGHTELGPATLQALMTSASLGNLRSLTLAPPPRLLAGRGAEKLAGWSGLARLRTLSLWGDVGLTAEGLRTLVASPHLAGLRELCLDRAGTLAEVFPLLAASPHLANLEWLQLDDSVLDAPTRGSVRKALRNRFGDRVIFSGPAE